MKTLNAMLIDPFDESTSYVDIPKSFNQQLDVIKKIMQCSIIDTVRLSENVIAIIDDEGLLKENRYFAFVANAIENENVDHFTYSSYAGRSVIVGLDTSEENEGDISSLKPVEHEIKHVLDTLIFMPDGYKVEPSMGFISFDDIKFH
mgnify:CR=1 FL=1